MIEATEPLTSRLMRKTIASCECMTKTNNHMFHDQHCLYRLLMEAMEVIEPDMFITIRP